MPKIIHLIVIITILLIFDCILFEIVLFVDNNFLRTDVMCKVNWAAQLP